MRARIRETKKTILIYGLNDLQQAELLSLANAAGVVCRAVTDAHTHCTVAQLFDAPNQLPTEEKESLHGKFAILDGFADAVEEGTALINKVDSSVIKAVRTVHNGGWKFYDLCAAILEEYQVMHGEKENPYRKVEGK